MNHNSMDHTTHDHSGHSQKPDEQHAMEGMDHAAHGQAVEQVPVITPEGEGRRLEPQAMDHAALGHESHGGKEEHAAHAHADHTGHEEMFRKRFWISLALSIPVLLFSPMVQDLLGFRMPTFPGSQWIEPVFAVVVFLYGGVPFLSMAVPELRNRQPGMMTLISLAITVAFVYSLAALFLLGGMGFFWELVTLIDIMLLGHWLEMRSVRQASGALDRACQADPGYSRAHPS